MAQQYIAGGVSGAAIDTIEQLLSEYGPSLPASDVETLNADLALAYFLTLIAVIKCFWQVLEARIGSKIRWNAQIAARVFADRNFKLETTATGC